MWCDVMCCDVTWRYVTWRDVLWRAVLWCDVTWRVTWCDVTWRDVTWRAVTWRNMMWRCVGHHLCVPVPEDDERGRSWTSLVGGVVHRREEWVWLHGTGLLQVFLFVCVELSPWLSVLLLCSSVLLQFQSRLHRTTVELKRGAWSVILSWFGHGSMCHSDIKQILVL